MKVLLATDGSIYSELAEFIGTKIPKIRAGTWKIVHVISPIESMVTGVEPLGSPVLLDDYYHLFEASQKRATQIVEEAKLRLNANGIVASAEIIQGNPVAELCALAEEEHFDVVLVGHKGVGAVTGFLLGSVAKAMVAKCQVSVLVGKSPIKDSEQSVREFIDSGDSLSIGIGWDGSSGATHALNAVIEQGENAFSAIYSICAHPLMTVPAGIDSSDMAEVVGEDETAAIACIRDAESKLTGLAPLISGGTGLGSACDVLCEFATVKHINLLVVGANQHGIWERWLLGSVTHDVVNHSQCSVWVVRPPKG